MTYFSRVRLNPTRRGTRRLVSSPQAMHAAVMGSHASVASDDGARILWRLDAPSPHDLAVYVVSPSRPDFTGLIEQAGWPAAETWDTTDYDRFLARLQRGQRWAFRLTANPVRSRSTELGRGKVSPHITVAHQEAWLLDRAERWGFEVPNGSLGSSALAVRGRHTAEFSRANGSTRRDRVAITKVDYTGVLEVADAQRLQEALVAGMGRAKAYGCGLMTLAPR